ncbi:MAG: V-type ATP synthase subunit I [Limnochordia bacterium]
MIVPMKKATLLVLSKHTQAATERLQELGVLHPVVTQTESVDLEVLRRKLQQVEQALRVLPQGKIRPPRVVLAETEAEELCERIVQLVDNAKWLQDERERLEREEARIAGWGDFDLSLLHDLQQRGLTISLIRLSVDAWKKLRKAQPELPVFSVQTTKTLVYAVLVGEIPRADSEEPDVALEEEPLPEQSLGQLRRAISRVQRQHDDVIAQLEAMTAERDQLHEYRTRILDGIEFGEVEASLEEHGAVAVITGYLPAEKADQFKSNVAQYKWGLILSDPGPDDEVPTLIRNKAPIRIIQPLMDLLGVIPGYREHDISLWFLLFFAIFFAMIIGDAGYGSLMLLASVYFGTKQKKQQGAVYDGIILLGLLSGATVVWGAITGNWFGLEAMAELPGFRSLVIPALNTYAPHSAATVQKICFVIGTIHITLAHLLSFIRLMRERNMQAFAQLGWMSTVLGLYYLVLNLVISNTRYPVPNFAVPMIVVGMVLVFIFQNQEGTGFFRGVLSSLGSFIPTILSGVSSFSDIISYIRLFAVGLAGLEIANSFNEMAVGFMQSGVVGTLLGVLIIVAGHSLNIAMAALSVVVHGVRLNMLEFSNHLGNEWAGFAYRPFAKRERNQQLVLSDAES